MNMKSILKRFDRIEASSIPNEKIAKRVANLQAKRKQGGFTLLELLVVVAIMAAIAGSVVVSFETTDARAAAAAHVQMMNELDNYTRTYRAVNKQGYPDRFDSLMESTAGAVGTAPDILYPGLGIEDLSLMAISEVTSPDDASSTAGVAGGVLLDMLNDQGLTTVRVVYDTTNGALDPAGDGDCDNTTALIQSNGNAVVAGNIFLSPDANGCGGSHTLGTATVVPVWVGGSERITGEELAGDDFADLAPTGAVTAAVEATATNIGVPVFMALGYGPSNELFDQTSEVGLSTVPVYRHVGPLDYNRFIALFKIGEVSAAGTISPPAEGAVFLAGLVDGAGDTKEEELGEWDGTRSTI